MRRYDLTDFDRRVLNGIFWVLRSGAPGHDLLECDGPRTTCYIRSVRRRRAAAWDRLMDAISVAYDGDIQMFASTSVRAHHQAALLKRGVEIQCPRRCLVRLQDSKHTFKCLV